MSYTLTQIIEGAILAAELSWEDTIRDTQKGHPGDIMEIERFFHLVDWGWMLARGKDGRYQESKGMMWCGIFAGACFVQAGDFLDTEHCVDVKLKSQIASSCFPSCPRLASERRWEQCGVTPPERFDPKDVQRGDILILDTPRTSRPSGDHIMIALGGLQEDGTIPTIEGNAYGTLGDGTYGEGVVKNNRPLERCLHAYRLRIEHFTGYGLI